MIPIRDRSELATALSQPRAFLFLWVNWASQARMSQSVVAQVVASWESEHPDVPVPCYTADVSDQCGEVWDALGEWLMAEDRTAAGPLMASGAGPLLWLRSGHMVHHVLTPFRYGSAELAVASRSAFASDV